MSNPETWTEELLTAVTGNERPWGLADKVILSNGRSVAQMIMRAADEGAPIELWYDDAWMEQGGVLAESRDTYRVRPGWRPRAYTRDEALAFYADPASWMSPTGRNFAPAYVDGGRIARSALRDESKEGGGE